MKNIFSSGTDSDHKFNTFAGVFTPTILTILGVIMYLRLGWVVGNAGLGGALLIISLAHLITFTTGLSVSSVATNTRVGAGGAFAIISQSLGLEIGGSVGVPLYLAQGVSVALYVLGFAEGLIGLFPAAQAPSMWLVALLAFAGVTVIAYVSARVAVRIQFIIMALVGLSLLSIIVGGVAVFGPSGAGGYAPVIWGGFGDASFWTTFAIFFPAVTGIMAGISMSGSLRDPRKSIPLGTMAAIIVGYVVYVALAYWLARVASPEELLDNPLVMVDKSAWGWAIYAGLLGATFSSALGSMVAAPRVMQALAVKEILPYSDFLAKEMEDGEPRNATISTGIIALIALLWALSAGGLDAVAQVISMFFLIAYGMLNLVVLLEQQLRMVSFRPMLQVPRLVPLMGLAGCILVMALVAPLFSIIAAVLILVLYFVLSRRQLVSDGDIRSGLFLSMAEWAAIRASDMPSAPQRTWKPIVLAPVDRVGPLKGSYRFLWAVTWPQGGVHALGIYADADNKADLDDLEVFTESFVRDGIYARTTLLEEADFVNGVRTTTQVLRQTFFRPNILFLHLRADNDLVRLQALVDKTAAYSMGIVLLYNHPVNGMGREQQINVWVSNQGPDWVLDLHESNMDLAILLAYRLAQNWEGHINLCMAVDDETAVQRAGVYLHDLSTLTRLPLDTEIHVWERPFMDSLSLAPLADLNIFGLSHQPDLAFCRRLTEKVDTSCVFVRDSGEESALA